ncbi:FG-GAP-like repeat-containing protein [Kovacikia minuta CCNUW1]|nr:FG-GAP-like repeat-containing protein [Kovacikia minuta CCNUW1]
MPSALPTVQSRGVSGSGNTATNAGDTATDNNDVFGADIFPPPNAAPVVTISGTPLSYTENNPAILLDPTATATDSDSTDFDTGKLTVNFSANGTADDRLAIRNQGSSTGQISVSGNTVSYGSSQIGTFTGGTDGTTPLVITLNASATPTAVSALLQNLTYTNVSENPSTSPRTVQLVLTDGDGGTSTAATKTINVTAVDDTEYVVTNTNDAGDGSLRQAVLNANVDPGTETIHFALPTGTQTISLLSALPTLSDSANILNTTGAIGLTIKADTAGAFSIFKVGAGQTVNFDQLTLSNGINGILNAGTTSISNSFLIGNTNGISNGSGGTITSIRDSSIVGNTGAGINNTAGTIASISNNTISDNTTGGIVNVNGTINTIIANTISGNQDGIANVSNGLSTTINVLSNNTISGNSRYGIFNQSALTTISNNTIAGNADFGIANAGTITNLFNNLLVGNGNNTLVNVTNQKQNFAGTFAQAGVDPVLKDNGGATKTHALLANSIAINKGVNSNLIQDITDLNGNGNTTELIPFDQRGQGFKRILGGNVDLGAVEYVPQPDYNSDGNIDLLWHNTSTGANVIWALNGTSYSTAFNLPVPKGNWQFEGTADFTGDGKADILWRNGTTGANVIWQLNGTGYSTAFALPTLKDTNWQIVGTADFTGDGKTDILWRNGTTGANVLWQMDGISYSTAFALPVVKGSNWTIEAAADLTGDNKADLLWYNNATGESLIWQMNGTEYTAPIRVSGAGSGLMPETVADFTGDGVADILLRKRSTGENIVWQLTSPTSSTYYSLPTLKGDSWTIQGAADFDGNGSTDILWRNSASGANVIWQMTGINYSTATALPPLASATWVNYL